MSLVALEIMNFIEEFGRSIPEGTDILVPCLHTSVKVVNVRDGSEIKDCQKVIIEINAPSMEHVIKLNRIEADGKGGATILPEETHTFVGFVKGNS